MSGDTTGSSVLPDTDKEILDIVRQVLGRQDVDLDDELFDKGATSLSFVRILARIRQDYRVTISPLSLPAATARHLASSVAAGSSATAQTGDDDARDDRA
jgi:acyl carrier protein